MRPVLGAPRDCHLRTVGLPGIDGAPDKSVEGDEMCARRIGRVGRYCGVLSEVMAVR